MIPPSVFSGATAGNYAAPPAQTGVYGGIQNYGMQSYLPIMEKHELEKPEEKDVQANLHNWWPKIGAGFATPAAELLASPGKSAILSGIGAALLGAIAGAFFIVQKRILGAGILGVLGAAFGAFTGFINRRQQNENILEEMKHLPAGATKRDLEADPAWQAKLNRDAMAHANSGGGDLLTGMMMASMFNTGGSRRR